jgi:hypothetical protein
MHAKHSCSAEGDGEWAAGQGRESAKTLPQAGPHLCSAIFPQVSFWRQDRNRKARWCEEAPREPRSTSHSSHPSGRASPRLEAGTERWLVGFVVTSSVGDELSVEQRPRPSRSSHSVSPAGDVQLVMFPCVPGWSL